MTTAQSVPDFHDTATKLTELLCTLNSTAGLKLIAQMQYAYEDLDQENTALLKECRQQEEANQQYEIRLDDIAATLDAVQTGFRQPDDLYRIIQA